MAGVESRSRLEQLLALERRIRHDTAAATRAGNRDQLRRLGDLAGRVAAEIAVEGGTPLPKSHGTPKTKRKKAEDRVSKRLQQLGVTAHDVKVWAVSAGLLDQVRRGRIKGEVVEAYAAAHTNNALGGAA